MQKDNYYLNFYIFLMCFSILYLNAVVLLNLLQQLQKGL